MEYKDYYKVLGVEKNADQDTIKKAYKKLAVKYHPDKNQNNKESEKRFKEINEAYQVIGEPDKRAKYDQLGSNWDKYEQFSQGAGNQGGYQNFSGFDGADIFGDIFKNFGSTKRTGRGRNQKGAGSAFGGFSDFFQTFFGGDFSNAGQAQNSSRYSANPNFEDYSGDYCEPPACSEADITITINEALSGCEKIYEIIGKRIKVNIPAGISAGRKIKLKGLGRQQRGINGDLLLKVNIINSGNFRIDGDNVILPVYITPYEAALGAELMLDLPIGKIKIRIPESSSGGKTLRIPGKGFDSGAGRRGDLLLELRIAFPPSITEGEKELYEKLKNISAYVPNRLNL